MYNNIHESKNYQNIREIIEDFTEQFGENIAFTIKHKNGKEVSYEDITYNEFHSDVIGLAKSLIHMGLKDKRIAIIKNNKNTTLLNSYINGISAAKSEFILFDTK